MNQNKFYRPTNIRQTAMFCGLVFVSLLLSPDLHAAAEQTFRTLFNRETGLRFEYPARWQYGFNRNGVLVIRGRKGTPPQFAIMTIQSLSGITDGAGELRRLLDGIRNQTGFGLIGQGVEKLRSGRQIPFFIVRYQSPLNGQPTVWQHVMTAVTQGNSVHLLSYRAPETIFKRYKKNFNHLILSLSFSSVPDSAVPASPSPPKVMPDTPPVRFEKRNDWISDRVAGYRFRLPRGWRYEVKDDMVYAFARPGGAAFFALGDVAKGHVTAEVWADAAEKVLSGRLRFMEKRLLHSRFTYRGFIPNGMEHLVRDYEGHVGKTRVRGHVLYATFGRRVYVVGIFVSTRLHRSAVRRIENVLNDFETTINTLEEALAPVSHHGESNPDDGEGAASIGARQAE